MKRRLSNHEAAEIIHDRVTMGRILAAYGIDNGRLRGTWKRIPCPLHNGEDKNFSYSDTGYKCWVCGEHGGVIQFVQTYRHLDYQAAIREIDTVCGLGIPFEIHENDPAAMKSFRKAGIRVEAERMISNVETQLNTQYRAAFDNDDYEMMLSVNQAIFEFEVYGKERLREYVNFVSEELEKDSDGNKVFDNQKRKMIKTAVENWRTKETENGYVPWRLYQAINKSG